MPVALLLHSPRRAPAGCPLLADGEYDVLLDHLAPHELGKRPRCPAPQAEHRSPS